VRETESERETDREIDRLRYIQRESVCVVPVVSLV
jgi:hypothetical protein